MEILYYGDSPFRGTGLSQVAKQLLPVFAEFGHVTCLLYGKSEEPPANCPYTILPLPPENDWLRFESARQHIRDDEYDMLFLVGDLNVPYEVHEALTERRSQHAKVVFYLAVDTVTIAPMHVDILRLADAAVVFSFFAQEAIRKINAGISTRVIYHGCEPDYFYPLPEEARKELRRALFRIDPDTFLVACFNRNQPRKDLARAMYAFHLFHERYPNSFLYMHACMEDLAGQLPTQAAALGLDVEREIGFTSPDMNFLHGIERKYLNAFYNSADLCISTSTGEGWGLTTTEAMAAGVPFIGPRNTTFPEILGEQEERGLLANSGGPDLWCVLYGWADNPRELTSVTSMVEKMERAYYERHGKAKERADAAREWTQQHTWEHKRDEWRRLIRELC